MINIQKMIAHILHSKEKKKKELRGILTLRLLSFMFLVLTLFFISVRLSLRLSLALLFLLIFINMVHLSRVKRVELDILEHKENILKELEEKRAGIYKGKEPWEMEVKPFLTELDILGEVSLYSFINQTETKGGKEALLSLLLNPTKEHREERFQAQKELKKKAPLQLEIRSLLRRIKDREHLDDTLLEEFKMTRAFSMLDLVFSAILNLAILILIPLTLLRSLHPQYVIILGALSLVSGLIYQHLYGYELAMISRGVRSLQGLDRVFKRLSEEDFKEESLKVIGEKAKEALKLVKGLKALEILDSFRASWAFNLLLQILLNLFSRVQVFFYQRFIKKDLRALKEGIQALFYVEVLMSLSSVGLLKERISEPAMKEELLIDVEDMIYPLLSEDTMVPNSFKASPGVSIITGSNMSGKTFFMKTLGLNLYLSYLGCYVTATSFKAPWLSLYSSINVKDDASKGISTFYAELLRVRDMLKEPSTYPKINFIDEIFKGTNATDRLFGAKETIIKLKDRDSFTLLTTHDRELCALEGDRVKNYYFEEDYDEGIMIFDHKLKPGTTSKSNAKVLMKGLGIIE